MSRRTLCVGGAAAVLVSLALSGPTPVAAQTVPHTSWGQPDLQGIWDFRTITPMQRPEDLGDKAFLTAEEAANLEQEAVDRNIRLWNQDPRRTEAGGNVGGYNNFWMDQGTTTIGTRRTSLIVDPPNGRMPEMLPAGQRRAAARRAYRREHPADSWLDRSTSDRCMMGFNAGPPITPAAYNQNMQLFQTEDHVVILTEMVHTARVVPIGRRPALGILQWSGDSHAHWEGDTLVIETTDYDERRRWRGSTETMKLVERITRLDEDTLEYEFTVDDPNTWSSSWTANVPMRRTDAPVFEYACHEGNYSLTGILGGTRAEEKTAADQP